MSSIINNSIPEDFSSEAYLAALLEGSGAEAARNVSVALESGWSPLQIYEGMMTPALRVVGDLWEQGRLGVAREHLSVQITLDQLAGLRSRFEPSPDTGKSVLMTTPPEESHWVGLRMAADYFQQNGLRVDFLGPDTPAAGIVDYVRQRPPDLIALSVTLSSHVKAAASILRELRKARTGIPVLMGGSVAGAARSWKKDIRPQGIAEDLLQGFQEACRLLKLDPRGMSLSAMLKKLGARIESLRKKRRWNQQALADRTGLDRTYISALEHGKQNVTLKVLLRLSEALEVPLESLIRGSGR
jgi:methanogenic corrinoid protein MtbC1/DNA-binding XRE family transcriptional regulator